jgi:hypothetical protein
MIVLGLMLVEVVVVVVVAAAAFVQENQHGLETLTGMVKTVGS